VANSYLLFLGLSALACTWAVLSLWVIAGRSRFERRRARAARPPRALTPRRNRRLVRRTRSQRRGADALAELVRGGHPESLALLHAVLRSGPDHHRAAALSLLSEIESTAADELLLETLEQGSYSRSRVAAELERRVDRVRPRLVTLVRHPEPVLRFWALTILSRLPHRDAEVAEAAIRCTHDPDANVRAAAAETLAGSSAPMAGPALHRLLGDDAFFVRAHAARAFAEHAGPASANDLLHLLADRDWWVRSAAKESLARLGTEGLQAAVQALAHDDPFARDGAAEVIFEADGIRTLFESALEGDETARQALDDLALRHPELLRTRVDDVRTAWRQEAATG
jgi:HEAT repeat protein